MPPPKNRPALSNLFRLGNAAPVISGAERSKRHQDKKKRDGKWEEYRAKKNSQSKECIIRKQAKLANLTPAQQKVIKEEKKSLPDYVNRNPENLRSHWRSLLIHL